ncbi:DUF7504 family protein [Halobaculum sp. D14]|uniref:DUF7504 family protein n=1 Tax=Halobaculum sp. D14 TaxID=3421642 RepID=UPI003EB76273
MSGSGFGSGGGPGDEAQRTETDERSGESDARSTTGRNAAPNAGPARGTAELVMLSAGPERQAELKRQAMTGFVGDAAVVEFTYRTDPATVHRRWCAAVGSAPPCHLVVDATGNPGTPGPQVAADGGTFAAASAHPRDLTGLCMKWQDALNETAGDAPLFVAFDSVTALLQYVDTREAFRFLRTLIGDIHRANARAQFYFDPDAHDDRAVSVIRSAFDRVRYVD